MDVASLFNFTLARRADGSLIAWGDNASGQCNIPADATNIVAIAAGNAHAAAVRADGTVITWGAGATTAPASATNIVAIAAGVDFTLALRDDGEVISWGSAPTGKPDGATNIVAISAGAFAAFALRADGQVLGWGQNDFGQTDIPDSLSDVLTNITITGSITGATNLITYTVVDASGNTGTVQRTVIVTSAPPATPLTITKQKAKVNFVIPLSDTTSFTATIGLPDDFAPSNQVVSVDIAGVAVEFTLDAKARATLLTGSRCALKKNPAGGWIITVKLGKGNYAAAWTDDGLTNETVINKPVRLPVTVTVGGQGFSGSKPLWYRATEGKGGTAK
jgi:hypothetical protein